MRADGGSSFEEWVTECRRLIAAEAEPESIQWADPAAPAPDDLFADAPVPAPMPVLSRRFSVPREFKDLAQAVYYHRSHERFHLLYSALWRLVGGERDLLEKLTDPIVHPLLAMRKQVTRDAHKMKAFVRFRRVVREGEEWYVAWHRPDHRIVRYVAEFFRDRFTNMNWSILTPDESVHWNQQELTFTGGVPHNPVQQDQVETLWRTYYASVFNPARLKVKAMKTEMPVRHWRTMPETSLIPELIAASSDRTSVMLDAQGQSAADFIPQNPTMHDLRTAPNLCRGCPLYHGTTQAVCSRGPADSPLVLVGEQPGDNEDLIGEPFVGPAGQLLDRALDEAGVQRSLLYITGAVKHFKHEYRNGRRFHRNPNAAEVAACRPWLIEEMKLVKPQVMLCLGTSAAHSVLGRQVTLKAVRGEVMTTPMCAQTLVTAHPAAVLRNPDPEAAESTYRMLVSDLRAAAVLAGLIAPVPGSPLPALP